MAQHHAGETVNAVEFIQQVGTLHEVKIPQSGFTVTVQTHNSLYEYNTDTGMVRGGKLGPEWRVGHFDGTTFGGSMIKVGYLIPGSFMEFTVEDATKPFGFEVYTSSVIQKVSLIAH